jgi:Polysaccharide deacetylase
MAPSPRVLLSIDYESWLTLAPRYNTIMDASERCQLDGGFTLQALDPILEKLGEAKASFYLVGEIAGWYPEIPNKIKNAGHEIGFHCQTHRSLVNISELAEDIRASAAWCKAYQVRGYRSPMVAISEAAYPLLERSGFSYSSSIYAPAGTLIRRGTMWELPVSTLRLFGRNTTITAPREYSMKLLLGGEFPYGSSFSIGVMGRLILKILERELQTGRSPVIILHPYELIRPSNWPARLGLDFFRNPLMWPFSWNKANFLSELLRHFPVSPLGAYLDEVIASNVHS